MDKKIKIIIAMSMLIVGLITFIFVDRLLSGKNVETRNNAKTVNNLIDKTTDNLLDNESSTDAKKSEVNTSENSTNEKNNKVSEKKENENKENTKSTAVSAVKDALKDEKWLKKNIYIQEDEKIVYGDIDDQEIYFLVCKSNDKPIIIICVASENVKYTKIILVSYNNGKVTAEKINEGHVYHGAYYVDANKCTVRTEYMHGGYYSTMYHNVGNGSVKFVGAYSSEGDGENYKYFVREKSMYSEENEISEQEYQKYKESLNESQYNFVGIGTKLTNQNVDKYVK